MTAVSSLEGKQNKKCFLFFSGFLVLCVLALIISQRLISNKQLNKESCGCYFCSGEHVLPRTFLARRRQCVTKLYKCCSRVAIQLSELNEVLIVMNSVYDFQPSSR